MNEMATYAFLHIIEKVLPINLKEKATGLLIGCLFVLNQGETLRKIKGKRTRFTYHPMND